LQRERLEQGQRNVSDPAVAGQAAVRPPLQTSISLANLLATHPVSAASTGRAKPEALAGTLLSDNAKAELEARKKLVAQNARATSYNVPRPAITSSKSLQNLNPTSVPGFYGQQPQIYGQQQPQQIYPQMNAGIGYPQQPFPTQQQMYPQFAQPSMGMLHQNAYGQMPNMQQYNQNMGAGIGTHLQKQMATGGGPYAGFDELQLSQGQRDLIDRWRLSVAQ
jgi:hypothetical protein